MEFRLDGRPVEVTGTGTLLDALRTQCGVSSVKDGCAPQGQCGCCTVWVDGAARLACVTPVTRVAGRDVTTLDSLQTASEWTATFAACGASQCGFCTPGIIMRLAALSPAEAAEPVAVHRALRSHLCRCTGWTPILEAAQRMASGAPGRPEELDALTSPRAVRRAHLEGGVPQTLGPEVARGGGGFAADTAPADARRARLAPDTAIGHGADLQQWQLINDEMGVHRPGRRSSLSLEWPVEPGATDDLRRVLQTTWVDPAYLEPDASWCAPGADPASAQANGGAFGAKAASPLPAVAAAVAARTGETVQVCWSREEVVRHGAKRPPMAIAVQADGLIDVRVARTAGIVEALEAVRLPDGYRLSVTEVDVPGPRTSAAVRAAGWAELAAVVASLDDAQSRIGVDRVRSPEGAVVTARWLNADIDADSDTARLHLQIDCGVDPTDAGEVVVARSYVLGAVHMAMGWVLSEGIAVDATGEPRDLTLRSFGIPASADMPEVEIEFLAPENSERVDLRPVNGSDAVYAAAAAAFWRRAGWPTRWPLTRAGDTVTP